MTDLVTDILDAMRAYNATQPTERRAGVSFQGVPIHKSRYAPTPTERTEKRVVVEEYVWRGRKEWRSRIVERTVVEDIAYTLHNTKLVGGDAGAIVAHPDTVAKLKERIRKESTWYSKI